MYPSTSNHSMKRECEEASVSRKRMRISIPEEALAVVNADIAEADAAIEAILRSLRGDEEIPAPGELDIIGGQCGAGIRGVDNANLLPGNRVSIFQETAKHIRRFNLDGACMDFKIQKPPANENPMVWLREAFADVYRYTTEGRGEPTDLVGITFFSPGFAQTRSAGISFRPARDLDFDALWRLVEKVAQSGNEVSVDETFTIQIQRVRAMVGAGRMKALGYEEFSQKSRAIITIRNEDVLCLPRALAVALARMKYGSTDIRCRSLVKNDRDQRQAAVDLMHAANVQVHENASGMGGAELKKFRKYFSIQKIVIEVYSLPDSTRESTKIVFDGRNEISANGIVFENVLRLLYFENHFNVITNLPALARGKKYCNSCGLSYKKQHRCRGTCALCRSKPRCSRTVDLIRCTRCNGEFFGAACLDNHRKRGSFTVDASVCESVHHCKTCDFAVTVKDMAKHVCFQRYCRACRRVKPVSHLCYIAQNPKEHKKSKTTLFVFYDFETTQNRPLPGNSEATVHDVNLCVIQKVCELCINVNDMSERCGVCKIGQDVFRINPVKQLLDFVSDMKGFETVICIAHNARAFDGQFILKHLVEKREITPELILNGSQILLLAYENIKFIDSLSYLAMPLSAFPRTFGLPSSWVKGYFPHFFNVPENQNYIGPLPHAKYYGPDAMSGDARQAFYEWYNSTVASGYVFDFGVELVRYCVSDVDILRQGCLAFRKTFMETTGICPFKKAITIASACGVVYRTNFLQADTIAIIPKNRYRCSDNQSLAGLKWLTWIENERGIRSQHANTDAGEKVLQGNIKVDGYYEEGDRKTVFEFYGCWFHGCNECYPNERHRVGNINSVWLTLHERYVKTVKKAALIRSMGYELVEIWEHEFRQLQTDNPQCQRFVAANDIVKKKSTLNPRDAFYGGRTGNTRTYYKVDEGQTISYLDVTSLYPYVMKRKAFPIKHPKVYIGEECTTLTGTNNDVSRVEGLIKCSILPPRNLYHPVLPLRSHGKLLFVLCRSCAEEFNTGRCGHDDERDRMLNGTWVSAEVQTAVQLGYVVTKIEEIWQFEVSVYDEATGSRGLFSSYVNCFLQLKQESSGFPASCTDEEQKTLYIEDYKDAEGINLNRDNIKKNPGLRTVAKLCLNSFWGKFGQRENQRKTAIFTDGLEFLRFVSDPEKEICGILPVGEDVVYVSWRGTEDCYESSSLTNVVIAAYTTAHARLCLYRYLEKIDRQCLYYDTDSIIFVRCEQPGYKDLPKGNRLGDLTDELEPYGPGSYISEFVSCGPKCYAYCVVTSNEESKFVCKVKGIRLNYQNSVQINFETLKAFAMTGASPCGVLIALF